MEHVDTGVDPVADKLDWLLDKSINDGRSWLGDHDTVIGWLCDLCDLMLGELRDAHRVKENGSTYHDGSLTSVGQVEITDLSDLLRLR